MCVGAVLSDLSVSEAFERELFIFSARLVSSSSAPSAFAKRKARVTALIGPTATENEFLLNAKVTITRPSSHLPPLSLSPSSFVAGGRQTAEQPIAIRAAVCQAAFK